jgi:putative transposase
VQFLEWFNYRRLLEPIRNRPPAEAEARFYSALKELAPAA